MGMSMGNDKPPAFVVSENSPESVTNVLDFQIPMPTPLPTGARKKERLDRIKKEKKKGLFGN